MCPICESDIEKHYEDDGSFVWVCTNCSYECEDIFGDESED
jgi:rubrerythrin